MNRQRLVLGGFLLLAAVQIAVPVSNVCRYEIALSRGQVFRFRTAPVDPSDPFRGRYLALRFEEEGRVLPLPEGCDRWYDQPVFVTVEQGADGFAELTSASCQRPADGTYLEGAVHLLEDGEHGGMAVSVRLPFNRYYLNEDLAPAAEAAYRSRQRSDDVHATVRIHHGFAVLEEIIIDGVPVAEYLRCKPAPAGGPG